jgi:hypothetical protein
MKDFWQNALTRAPGPVLFFGRATLPRQYGALQSISSGQAPVSPCSSKSLGGIFPHAGAIVVVIVDVVGEHPTVVEVFLVTQLIFWPEAVGG